MLVTSRQSSAAGVAVIRGAPQQRVGNAHLSDQGGTLARCGKTITCYRGLHTVKFQDDAEPGSNTFGIFRTYIDVAGGAG